MVETCGGLADPGRLRALAELGLGARPDPRMDVFAARVRRRVGTPIALVSLVTAAEQVFPGAAGWAHGRSAPLVDSFCAHVVRTAGEVVVPDTGNDPGRAYAGVPLVDDAGNVLGSLAAIDTHPRAWADPELDALREIAEACATELRLRLSRYGAEVERVRRDGLEHRLRRSFTDSQALLEAAQAFNGAVSVPDVRRRVGELVGNVLRPSYVGLVLAAGGGRLRRSREPTHPPGTDPWWTSLEPGTHLPSAIAVRERRLVVHEDRTGFDAAYGDRARAMLREVDVQAVVAAPLLAADEPLGALLFGWARPRDFTPSDLLILTTITGYAAQALDRAQRLQHRSEVAALMQRAMLTTLPDTGGWEVAARYAPGDEREHVGGDWYDLVPLFDALHDEPRPRPGRADRTGFAVSVGDIIGHDVAAATVMGQVRSMLRQAGWDHPQRTPSAVLTAFENACADLGVPARGTAVLAHLRPGPVGWAMTWTNAGHPRPVLLAPGRPPAVLDGHDALFGFAHSRSAPRRDHRCVLPPCTTVVLHTDGLVEDRGVDLDTGTARLLALLDRYRAAPPQELVDACVDQLAADAGDDAVALAFRVPPAGP